MSLFSQFWPEGRLLVRTRWILGLFLLLPVLALLGGPYGTWKLVMGEWEHAESMREVFQHEFVQWVLSDESNMLLREALWLLHPTMGANYLLAVLAVLGAMVTPIVGAHLIGAEFKWRTARVKAAHFGWAPVIATKLLWILVLGLTTAATFAVLGVISGRVTWSFAQDAIWLAELLPPPTYEAALWRQIPLVTLGLTLYGLVGALLALVTRSTLAGALAGLALPYVEWFAVGSPPWGWWLPRIAYGNLMVDHFAYLQGGFVGQPMALVSAPVPAYNWIALVAWIILLAGSTYYFASRQEI